MIIPVHCLLLCSCDECFAFPFPAITILSRYQSQPLSVCGTCRIGDCPSIVFAPRFLSSSPHHQVGSVWLIHSARHRPSVCSWRFILGSSPRGTGQDVNPGMYHRELRCLLHCSLVLQSLQFWSSYCSSRPFDCIFPLGMTFWYVLLMDQWVSVTHHAVSWHTAWCHPWGWQMVTPLQISAGGDVVTEGVEACRTAEVTGHAALDANSGNWLWVLYILIFYVWHTAHCTTVKDKIWGCFREKLLIVLLSAV